MSAYRKGISGLGILPHGLQMQRGLMFGVMIIGALLAFEIFNFSTTQFALQDLLGDLDFMGVRWASILALAFCGIDFAGIARLFTPEEGADEPAEVWYLFGAWLLAATMNAMLTWWGVSIAVLSHETLGNAVVSREMLLKVVPIFVAVLVWLSRVLLIGSFSVAGDRLFSQADQRTYRSQAPSQSTSLSRVVPASQLGAPRSQQRTNQPASYQSYPRKDRVAEPYEEPLAAAPVHPEPTYHPINRSTIGNTTRSNSPGNPPQFR